MRGDALKFECDPDNGMIIGPSGCHYETKADAMYYDVVGLCGCGCPEEVHQFLIDCLKEFHEDWNTRQGVRAVKGLVLKQPDVAAEFIAHFLDKIALLEHGGSVYGAWMTDLGEQFVKAGVLTDGERS